MLVVLFEIYVMMTLLTYYCNIALLRTVCDKVVLAKDVTFSVMEMLNLLAALA